MGGVTHLHTGSTSLTVEQSIENARTMHKSEPLTDVLIVGYDSNGDLFISSSAMNRQEATYLALLAVDHARGLL